LKLLAGTSANTYTNTAIGFQSGYNKTSGYSCIYIGGNTQSYNAATQNNEIVIGAGLTGKGTNIAFIGGSSGVYNEKNSTSFETTSDRRIKKNILPYTKGLNEIV